MQSYSTPSSAIVPLDVNQPSAIPAPPEASRGGHLRRLEALDPESGVPAVEWQPVDPQLRIVGPGRKERALRSEILEQREGRELAERALETAQLVERGTNRYVDRVEQEQRLEHAQNQRLLVALGALQESNQALRLELEALKADRPRQIEAEQPLAEAVEPAKLGWRGWFRRQERR
ncbi:MAG: hypothetical protein ACI8QC_003106 [Planctomycetota bacterium]|jgi:hypothetical protein